MMLCNFARSVLIFVSKKTHCASITQGKELIYNKRSTFCSLLTGGRTWHRPKKFHCSKSTTLMGTYSLNAHMPRDYQLCSRCCVSHGDAKMKMRQGY
jgi:hypothetical protein